MAFTPGIYQHYKGGLYVALGLEVWHDAHGEGIAGTFVSYICLYANNTEQQTAERCIRPLDEWDQRIKVERVVNGEKGLVSTPRYRLITPLGP